MTRLALLLGAVVTLGFWGAAWFYPAWGAAGLLGLAALLWLFTRDARAPAPVAPATPDFAPTTQPASLPPPADERRRWLELPPAVRERLGQEPGAGHEIWAGVRPDAAGEARTEWRVVNQRGEVVQAFWLDV